MNRPTRYCAKCGEYVKEDWITVRLNKTVKKGLVHIDADGRRIYRNHAPVEDIQKLWGKKC